MSASIAIITTNFLKPYIEETLRGFPLASEFEVHYLRDLKSLLPVYRNLSKAIRGVVVSSSVLARILELSFPDAVIPIRSFDNDNTGIYKLFLELLNEDRSLKLERVFSDEFDFVRIKPEVFLFGANCENFSDLARARVAEMSLDDLLVTDERYAARHIELWQNGQIDISITRVSLIVERLRRAGLNVRFAYPDMLFVRNILSSALQEVTIKGLTDNLPCSVIITARRNTELSGDKLRRRIGELGSHVSVFSTNMKLRYHVQMREDGFEIFTNHKTAEIITENFTACKLRRFLSGRMNLNLDIGYGIGFSLYQAHVNAMDATREACILPFAASCLKDERDKLTVPLDRSDLISQLAVGSGLSYLTVQKIITAASTLPDGSITSEELSHTLSLAKRSTSRFLNVLHKSGLACIVGKKQTSSKGRPENVYKLNLDAQA